MLQLIQPVFGDLMLYGVGAMGWFFILFLIADAWWEKRQARLMRQQARAQLVSKRPARSSSFRKGWGGFFLVAAMLIAVVALLKTHKASFGQDQDLGATPLATYVAQFKGEMLHSAPAVKDSIQMVVTDLWDEPVLQARTLNLAVDTNLFEGQNFTQEDQPRLHNRTP